jgi:chromosome segregation protein
MVQFTRLRLSGFKSFVDPTELVIEPGLTGVVGPNGCGKSNLVEALRWVMGESSARQMRGGEMDDVIFGGTSQRPARNIAEVTIGLDNSDGSATAFRQFEDLDVTRRIERGSGSVYRVNGKEARARDVQLLFADAATGARSTAMVSQGRVGALIAARPAQRRALLEEAAGIAGLHSRRHEAELRLKGADANLERLDDILSALDGQARNLRKQARQAAQYRALSESIRAAEAIVLRRRWLAAIGDLDAARTALREDERLVGELTAALAEANRRAEAAAEALAPVRNRATEAAAALQRLSVERDRLADEAARVAASRDSARARQTQTEGDLERERSRAADAEAALGRLDAEAAELARAAAGEDEARAASRTRLDAAQAQVDELDGQVTRDTQALAEIDANRAALDRRIREAEEQAARLAQRRDGVAAERDALRAGAVSTSEVEAAEAMAAEAEASAQAAADGRGQTEAARAEARAAMERAREAVQTVAAERARLRAEVEALDAVLAEPAPASGAAPAILDSIRVAPGDEGALGAALGGDLSVGRGEADAAFWAELPPLTDPAPLPAGVPALADSVTAPAALARRLASVGVVRDRETGDALRHDLRPGQRLVTRDGDLWRWDGLTLRAGAGEAAGDQAAARLRTRNRLSALRTDLDAVQERVAEAEAGAEAARAALTTAEEAERAALDRQRAADAALSRARAARDEARRKAAEVEARLTALAGTLDQLEADAADAARRAEAARAERAALGDGGDSRAALDRRRAALAEARTALVEARAEDDRLKREIGDRQRRRVAVADEITSWRARLDQGRTQIEALQERLAGLASELAGLEEAPARLEAERGRLSDAVAEAEAARRAADDALAAADTEARAGAEVRRDAEAALARAREDRVRREAQVDQGRKACRDIASTIAERLDTTPEGLPEAAGLDPDEALPALETAEADLQRLARERDTMGPVNLRAEAELAELDEKVAALRHEREDLTGAISRLRHAIQEINREGRQRLRASFAAVNEHFQTLFARLFGGGEARLDMIESDDPLEAGLEIMASPPGKRLQMLSLLSGGEQALTALALLFAVFLTNPAPICVLDEVDAPLDDANVDRLCRLLEGLSASTSTRFLLVTHHRMTMARMDRLFGVTMMERGISTLVSVDLRQAERLRDQGSPAAPSN